MMRSVNSNPVLRHFRFSASKLADCFEYSLIKDIDMIKDIAGQANWTISFIYFTNLLDKEGSIC